MGQLASMPFPALPVGHFFLNYDHSHFLGTFYTPGTELGAFHTQIINSCPMRQLYYPHFTGGETKVEAVQKLTSSHRIYKRCTGI